MSELKLISPLLDNYDIGSSISSHNGVACYPAMKKETTDRYIIKNISVPASQTQLEALLLTGAYPDADSALSYFHVVADGIVLVIFKYVNTAYIHLLTNQSQNIVDRGINITDCIQMLKCI